MIENGRDEDVCRQWDALSDEDHTHLLTPQEYYHYKSNWWLRSNKTGSNTVPVERNPDFETSIVYLAANETERRSSKKSTMGTKFLHGGVGKDLGGLLVPVKVIMEMNQVLIEQGDLLYEYLETSLQGMIFLNSFTL